jgi:hypothetical protein
LIVIKAPTQNPVERGIKKGFESIKSMLESGKCLVGFIMGEGEDWFGYVLFGVKKWGRGFEGEGLSWI